MQDASDENASDEIASVLIARLVQEVSTSQQTR
jgi:hypothetical protein